MRWNWPACRDAAGLTQSSTASSAGPLCRGPRPTYGCPPAPLAATPPPRPAGIKIVVRGGISRRIRVIMAFSLALGGCRPVRCAAASLHRARVLVPPPLLGTPPLDAFGRSHSATTHPSRPRPGIGVTLVPQWATNALWPCTGCSTVVQGIHDAVIIILETGGLAGLIGWLGWLVRWAQRAQGGAAAMDARAGGSLLLSKGCLLLRGPEAPGAPPRSPLPLAQASASAP